MKSETQRIFTRVVRSIQEADYDVDADRCEQDLVVLLAQLVQRQLIDIVDNV